MKDDHNPDKDQKNAKSPGEAVRVVGSVPLVICFDQFAFPVDMSPIIGGMIVKEGHEGAVSHERYYAVGFIAEEFQCADPGKDDKKGDTRHFLSECLPTGEVK